MKRLLFTALLWTVALHAQGRMGGAVHSSSPAPARSSAPHYSAPSGGFRAAPAVRSMSTPRMVTSQPFARHGNSSVVTRSFTGLSGNRVFVSVNGNRFHHGRHFRPVRPFVFTGLNSNCFNTFAFNSPFCNTLFNPYYYPIFPYDYSTPPAPPSAVVNVDDSQSRALSMEVERLNDEIDQMREENRRADRQDRDQAETTPRPAGLTEPPRVLVFKDGHQILADNYAISSNMIWIIENGKVKKIPLDEVDVAATQKANADTDLHLRH